MRTVRISASFGGKIPTGSYQNSSPSFFAEETVTLGDEYNEAGVAEYIKLRQQILQMICYGNFEAEAVKARMMKIKQDRADFRFYKDPVSGEEYPSVTTVLNYDKEFFVSDEELKQYAAQGNLIDAEVRNFVKTGKWVSSKELKDCTADRFIIKTGSKQLALEGWNFQAFLEKYPIKDMKSCEEPVMNKEWKYAGTPDLVGVYNDLPTLVSIKRTLSEVDNLVQDSAYAKCKGMEHIKQIMVVPLKAETDGGNKQGYSKPAITQDIDRYFEIFIYKRKEFRKIYEV